MLENEKFLIRVAFLMLTGQTLTARCETMQIRCFTTRMKALQILGVEPTPTV